MLSNLFFTRRVLRQRLRARADTDFQHYACLASQD